MILNYLNKVKFRKFSNSCSTMVRFINKEEAINIDNELCTVYKYSIDQLMELAGLSCSIAIHRCYPQVKKILVCCGPGNNGGDGLVTARHLKLFGFEPYIYYPRRPEKVLYQNLMYQCSTMKINFVNEVNSAEDLQKEYELIVDAVFGFRFSPPVQPDFEKIMDILQKVKVPICSLDVPSGWDIEEGILQTAGMQPDMLVSLTAPKKCARFFTGRFHYLGGRFIPPDLEAKYNLGLAGRYPGSDLCVKLN